MRGSRTIAVASLARYFATRRADHALGLGLDRVVDREVDVAALALGRRADDVERAAEGILDDRLPARLAGELLVERELEAAEAVVVEARVAEQLRGDRPLRVGAPLLRVRGEPGQVEPRQLRRRHRIGLARDVDEAVPPVGELRGERLPGDAEDRAGALRLAARIGHLARVRVDRRRLLADRELHPGAVVDRPAAGGDLDRLAVLLRGHAAEARRLHALEPRGAREHGAEADDEDEEQQPDATVRQAAHLPRST